MIDYTIFYKESLDIPELHGGGWDLFISAHNKTERVNAVFEGVRAHQKEWISHSEYRIDDGEIPQNSFRSQAEREDEFIVEFFESRLPDADVKNLRICIDITGFMRPHMLYLMHYLSTRGVKKLDVLYAEPSHYRHLDNTSFAGEQVYSVRQIAGYEGVVSNRTYQDLLIINAGFEDKLTSEVAEDKDKAKKVVLLGLPSLKADMYQQGVLRTQLARDALGESVREVFAPASDPFATATVLSQLVEKEKSDNGIDNLYMSPLATKPSALGMALFYIRECRNQSANIVFPFSKTYAADSSEGVGRIWKYEIELN